MTRPREAPYGSWKSPITADLIVTGSISLGQIVLDGHDVYWTEGRPTEGGRSVIVRRRPDGGIEDVTPPPFNARTRVHEYGGGDFAVAGGVLYFANFSDQRLYRVPIGGAPEPLTSLEGMRYADFEIDRAGRRLICVREDHSDAEREAVNTIVAVDLETGAETVLIEGDDFYAAPRLSPDGAFLAWLSWDHPNMPWDGCELWLAGLDKDGDLPGGQIVIAGGREESIFQPEWSPDGTLHFVSDRSGWWNLYRWRGAVEPLMSMAAEFGRPQWTFAGYETHDCADEGRVVCSFYQDGRWQLTSLDPATKHLAAIDQPYSEIRGVRVGNGRAYFVGGAPTSPSGVVGLDLATGATELLRRASDASVEAAYLSQPEAIEFPTEDGLTAHAFFYPPRNGDFVAPAKERPPLLVLSHGGPTSAAAATLSLRVQYWTSRGVAVLDVNYGGSTGYGRAYRARLDGRWGRVDVDDCLNGALYLARAGRVDGDRLAITGGSAGGFTTLCALAFGDGFKAGASHYGVADLEALARDTHKFESRYLDRLVGPYPERRDLYVERSPISAVDRLTCPVIFFQGLEDKIVPPNQAEAMVAALRSKGVPVAYVAFEGEQHGFRKAENIKRALDGELYFYSRVFGFSLADPVEPVPIENL